MLPSRPQAMSPDGEAIVTGAGDETLRFWNVFSKTRSTKVKWVGISATRPRPSLSQGRPYPHCVLWRTLPWVPPPRSFPYVKFRVMCQGQCGRPRLDRHLPASGPSPTASGSLQAASSLGLRLSASPTPMCLQESVSVLNLFTRIR